jgi:hypothetical protein
MQLGAIGRQELLEQITKDSISWVHFVSAWAKSICGLLQRVTRDTGSALGTKANTFGLNRALDASTASLEMKEKKIVRHQPVHRALNASAFSMRNINAVILGGNRTRHIT